MNQIRICKSFTLLELALEALAVVEVAGIPRHNRLDRRPDHCLHHYIVTVLIPQLGTSLAEQRAEILLSFQQF